MPETISERDALAVTITLFKEVQAERDIYKTALEKIQPLVRRIGCELVGPCLACDIMDITRTALAGSVKSTK